MTGQDMSGRNVKADLLWHLRDGNDDPERLIAALAPCVVLTADEAAQVRGFIEWMLSSGMPDWEDVERQEALVLALLTPEQNADFDQEAVYEETGGPC